jgi:hypothetical protein
VERDVDMPTSSSDRADAYQGPETNFSRAGTPALGSVVLALGGHDVLGEVGGCVLAAVLLFLATDRSIRPAGSGRSLR